MTLDDDQLLDVLGAVLRPPEEPPDPVVLAALQRAVRERADARPAAGFWPSFRRNVSRPFVVVLVGAAVLSGGTAVALTNGAPLPRPVRSAAHALGLPVDSVAVAEVRSTMGGLEDALAAGDVDAVRQRSAELRAELADLSAEDRAEVGPVARALLRRADVFLDEDEAGVGDDAGSGDEGRGDAGGAAPGGGSSADDNGTADQGSGDTGAAGDDPVDDLSGDDGSSGTSGSSGSGGGGSGGSGSGAGDDDDDDDDGGSTGGSGTSGSGTSGSGGGSGSGGSGSGSDDDGDDDSGGGSGSSGGSGSGGSGGSGSSDDDGSDDADDGGPDADSDDDELAAPLPG